MKDKTIKEEKNCVVLLVSGNLDGRHGFQSLTLLTHFAIHVMNGYEQGERNEQCYEKQALHRASVADHWEGVAQKKILAVTQSQLKLT